MPNRAHTIERDDDALFVKNGVPVKFCFHRSVRQGLGQISRNVLEHGGQIVRHERETDVLLVDEQEDIEFMRRRYYSSTELWRHSVYIEPRGFVQHCVRLGTYRHIGPRRQGMPGLVPGGGRDRVAFTEDDRQRLAYYIATRFPVQDGRMGNNAYKELVRLGETNDRSWAWARRHTWHSWREHYKMNRDKMNLLVDNHLRALKDVGHHLGHDPRRHDHRNLRQEEEEEGSGEEEQGEQLRRVERRVPERREREQVGPGLAVGRRARNHPARHEQDFVPIDDEEDEGIQEEQEIIIQEPQRPKRRRVHPDAHRRHDIRETPAKRARAGEASTNKRRTSGVEAGRGERVETREKGGDESEGSDLFGDRTYGSQAELDDAQQPEDPMSPPRANPAPGSDGAPLSTQATLVATPVTARRGNEKELSPARSPRLPSLSPVERPVPAFHLTLSPSSQRKVVATRERLVAHRARVRGASAQPGPSVAKETRARAVVPVVEVLVPRSTWIRSRSGSVEPQAQTQAHPASQSAQQQRGQGGKGKGRAREETPVSTEEDAHIGIEEDPKEAHTDEEEVVEEVVPVTSGRLSTRETFEDEMAVEGLLEADVGSAVSEDGDDKSGMGDSGGSDGGVHDEGTPLEVSDGDNDEDLAPDVPRYQDIGPESDPTDSDDAETHAELMRGAVRKRTESIEGDDTALGQRQVQEQVLAPEDSDSDDEDSEAEAARIERMAQRSLHALPVLSQTHGKLVEGAVQEGTVSVGGDDPASEQRQVREQVLDLEESSDSDVEHEDADADRIERMAQGSLHALPMPIPTQTSFKRRVTRSQTRTQTQVHPQISPRRTPLANQARDEAVRTTFPSPGTKARAVVDRSQEEGRMMPYEPPAGSRAAKVVRGRGKQG